MGRVYFYQTMSGDYPVKDKIEKLDRKMYVKVLKHIQLLRVYGPHLGMPYSKKLSNGLFELRIKGNIALRIFYANYKGDYYLLHSLAKKTNKTPLRDLRLAMERKKQLL